MVLELHPDEWLGLGRELFDGYFRFFYYLCLQLSNKRVNYTNWIETKFVYVWLDYQAIINDVVGRGKRTVKVMLTVTSSCFYIVFSGVHLCRLTTLQWNKISAI